jgi:ribosome biogenesis protein Nip4
MSVIAKPLRGDMTRIRVEALLGEKKIWISEQTAIMFLYSTYIYSFYNRDEVRLPRGTRSVFTCKFSNDDLSPQRSGFDP